MNEKPIDGSIDHALAVFKALPPGSRRRMLELVRKEDPTVLMSDTELCELLGISTVTLRSHLDDGPPKSARSDGNAIDVRMIQRADVGIKRRWLRSSVMSLINGE